VRHKEAIRDAINIPKSQSKTVARKIVNEFMDDFDGIEIGVGQGANLTLNIILFNFEAKNSKSLQKVE
jgi:hypothetical protein